MANLDKELMQDLIIEWEPPIAEQRLQNWDERAAVQYKQTPMYYVQTTPEAEISATTG